MLLGKAETRGSPEPKGYVGTATAWPDFVFPETSPALQSSNRHAASNPTWQIFSERSYLGARCVLAVSSWRFRCVQSKRKAMFLQPGGSKVIILVPHLAFKCNPAVPTLLLEALQNLARRLQISVPRQWPVPRKSGKEEFPDKLWENFTPSALGKSRPQLGAALPITLLHHPK